MIAKDGPLYFFSAPEAGKPVNAFWGPPQERLALHVLHNLPVLKEHVETRILRNKLQPAFDQVN